jgi:hypothetical protein
MSLGYWLKKDKKGEKAQKSFSLLWGCICLDCFQKFYPVSCCCLHIPLFLMTFKKGKK